MMHSKYESSSQSFIRNGTTMMDTSTEFTQTPTMNYLKIVRTIIAILLSISVMFCICLSIIGYCLYEKTIEGSNMNIYTPINDHRIYKEFLLPNYMEVLVVSDPTTTTSSAAISVGVGTLQNPREINGLAHLLEHMLFLGSKKYKDPSTLGKLAERSGGYINAYTSNEETNYYFVCGNEEFQAALDVFSWFFKDPLLDPLSIEKEINNVNSEHRK